MSLVSVTESSLENIAAAIRNKKGGTDTYTPGQMAGAINGIHTADEVVLVQKSITANGTYNPAGDSADGYSEVSVDVANSYTSDDNGKVVSNQQLVAQTSKQITQNGTHDTTTNNSVSVAVPNSYSASDNGKVVVNQALVAQTSKNINANGTHDTTANNSVVVDVPNSYASADEGKVVSGGALVGQTSRNVTDNGTYDTTNNNEVVVNVPTGGDSGTLIPKTVTQNGTYNASDDNADGYSSVTVNVSGGSGSKVKIMDHGQVSSTSNYQTAYFDNGVDFSIYDLLLFELYSNDEIIGKTYIYKEEWQQYQNYIGFIIPGTNYTNGYQCKFTHSNKTVTLTYYSGSYKNLYLDVYGVTI